MDVEDLTDESKSGYSDDQAASNAQGGFAATTSRSEAMTRVRGVVGRHAQGVLEVLERTRRLPSSRHVAAAELVGREGKDAVVGISIGVCGSVIGAWVRSSNKGQLIKMDVSLSVVPVSVWYCLKDEGDEEVEEKKHARRLEISPTISPRPSTPAASGNDWHRSTSSIESQRETKIDTSTAS